MSVRHFLSLLDLTPQELHSVVERASELKAARRSGKELARLDRRVLGMLFEKSSTRTRVAFEAAMLQAGGGSVFLSPRDCQLGRGEPIPDTARVVSSMVDAIVIRTFGQERIDTFAQYSSVPVINALSDQLHPCQLLADMQTFAEHRGAIAGRVVAWIGDGNNMCNSYINAARQFDFQLRIACPPGFEPDQGLLTRNQDRVKLVSDPAQAVSGASMVSTDVWASMGQEEESDQRLAAFRPFQVTPELLDQAADDAVFMHCLPAHRGEEVSETLLDDPRSVVWDQAENRLHSQKALLELLLTP